MWFTQIGLPVDIGSRRKRSGRRRRAAVWLDNGFRGAIRFPKVRPITTEIPPPTTTWDRMATTQPLQTGRRPTRVRWAILPRTVMGSTTWRATSLSGAGIGMERRIVNQLLLIQQARHLGATVCCAAAFGSDRKS